MKAFANHDDGTEEQIAVLTHLRELIEALDRRIPQLQRQGEADIARDSAELKQKAQFRLAELEAISPKRPS